MDCNQIYTQYTAIIGEPVRTGFIHVHYAVFEYTVRLQKFSNTPRTYVERL